MRTLVLTLLSSTALVQSSFEVASIKPTPPSRQGQFKFATCAPDGRFTVAGTPVAWVLRYAFSLKDYQVTKIPDWATGIDTSFDIEAVPLAPTDASECRRMLQVLLAERFQLKTHTERKDTAVYLLVQANDGAKLREGGPVRINGSVEIGAQGEPTYPNGLTLPRLATMLSDWAGRPVVDRTGLTASYGINLDFARNPQDQGPSIFTAVQEQLGLKLESGRAPIEVLIIDRLEKPSEN